MHERKQKIVLPGRKYVVYSAPIIVAKQEFSLKAVFSIASEELWLLAGVREC